VFVRPSLQADGPPCSLLDSVRIEKFKTLTNKSLLDTESKIQYPKELYFKDANGTYRGCVCELKKCIRKCCPADQHILNGSTVCHKHNRGWNNFSTSVFRNLMRGAEKSVRDQVVFLFGFQNCSQGQYRLEFDENPDDNFTLLDDGKVQLLGDTPPDPIDISQYCVDYFEGWISQFLSFIFAREYVFCGLCFALHKRGNLFFGALFN
jgi:hypothetical protein